MFDTIRAYLSAANAVLVTGTMKPTHLSMRPSVLTAGHLYALLQRDFTEDGATLIRVLIMLGAFALLAISPTVYLWRLGVLGALGSLVWAFYLISEQSGRNWFMHRLTLQDALDSARGSFGGIHDVDSLCVFSAMAGEPIRPDDLIAAEQDLAALYVEQAREAELAEIGARVERAFRHVDPPTDTAH